MRRDFTDLTLPLCLLFHRNSLQNHQLTVHSLEVKRYPCPFEGCEFVADKPYSLKTHTWTHKEERNFICTFEGCEYRGKTKAALWKWVLLISLNCFNILSFLATRKFTKTLRRIWNVSFVITKPRPQAIFNDTRRVIRKKRTCSVLIVRTSAQKWSIWENTFCKPTLILESFCTTVRFAKSLKLISWKILIHIIVRVKMVVNKCWKKLCFFIVIGGLLWDS